MLHNWKSNKNKNGVNVPLCLCLDVKARWASALFILKRYLKLLPYDERATAELHKCRFIFKQLRPGLPLTASQMETFKALILVISSAEDGTALLGHAHTPKYV